MTEIAQLLLSVLVIYNFSPRKFGWLVAKYWPGGWWFNNSFYLKTSQGLIDAPKTITMATDTPGTARVSIQHNFVTRW